MSLTKVITKNCQALQLQQKTNWCWAATAANVEQCNLVFKTQCDIASLCVSTCNNGCFGAKCNTPHYLDQTLGKIGRLKGWTSGQVARSKVVEEIDGGHPVGIRVRWRNGIDGHFVLLVGYGSKRNPPYDFYYLVFDPNIGLHALEDKSMRRANGYQIVGTWSETFLTT